MISPPFLNKGDKIGIVASARKISMEEVMPSIDIINDYGYEVVTSNSLFEEENQYAGNDKHRANELQKILDDSSIKAILFARGGYGSVRIIDRLDFTAFVENPCWLIGYSDITVFHSHVSRNFGIQTLHATMPINFPENSPQAIQLMFDALSGKDINIEFKPHELSKHGEMKGEITGGNLSVLYSLIGSISFPDLDGKILFIEDLDEYLYHIDRMMIGLKRAGKLEKLSGLVVGGMTDMNDNKVPFGMTAKQIISEAVSEYNYPVYFGFPTGHIENNMPITLGKRAIISAGSEGSEIKLSYC